MQEDPQQELQDVHQLFLEIQQAVAEAAQKLQELREAEGQGVGVADMFEMQMLMNHFSQLSEMSTSVVQASNAAMLSMARNVKG